jgi:hypothetical protein
MVNVRFPGASFWTSCGSMGHGLRYQCSVSERVTFRRPWADGHRFRGSDRAVPRASIFEALSIARGRMPIWVSNVRPRALRCAATGLYWHGKRAPGMTCKGGGACCPLPIGPPRTSSPMRLTGAYRNGGVREGRLFSARPGPAAKSGLRSRIVPG